MDNQILNISSIAIDRHLELNGWERLEHFKNKKLMVYTRKELNGLTIAVPANEKMIGFYENIEPVLNTIAYYENKSLKELIKEINTTYIDRLEFRIISNEFETGKIPLEYAAECIDGLSDLILYSACAENDAKPICHRPTDAAKSCLNKFQLAQTEVGSFIINLDVAVVDEEAEQLTFNNEAIIQPIEHKVIKRIVNAINQVESVVKQREKLTNLTKSAFQNGITANMCDAFLKLKPDDQDVEIETTIRYASAITNSKNRVESFDINNVYFNVIDEISKIYKDKILYEDVVLEGYIFSLKKDNTDEPERCIKLSATYEGKTKAISMILSKNDYNIACDAHKYNSMVRVVGELNMSNNHWKMNKVNRFEVIEN